MPNTPTTPASVASRLTDEEILNLAELQNELGNSSSFSVLRDYVRLRREVAELRECLRQAVNSRCEHCFAFNRTCDGKQKKTKNCPTLAIRDGKVKRLNDECKVLRWRKALDGGES